MPQDKVYIVGVAPEGLSSLSPKLRRMVNQVDVVFGGERLLEMFPSLRGQKIAIRNNLDEVSSLIKANLGQKRMVVLASGDPGFYGIAKYLTDKLGKGVLEIIPNVSTMQMAFARIKESWDDTAFASVHSRPIEDIIDLVRANSKIGLFTDDKHTPGKVARTLLENGIENCQCYVCQDLGTEEECVIASDLLGLKNMEFSPLNIMILIRDAQKPGEITRTQQLMGYAEERFQKPATETGLITKTEVRAVSLAKLCLTKSSVVWDIGAGSGAVSIEASLLASEGSVFAIEKNSEAVAAINENIRRFGCHNVRVLQALAPDGIEELPAPGAVFVGGSGGNLGGILHVACRRLKPKGRIVINAATLETLHTAVDALKANGLVVDVTLVNVARSKDILNLTRFEALNPVFIITGRKGTETTSDQR
ncbi:MAG: precorrin-6y C5,15-methyltransferase (decarboxylating) subunit CbiE [Chloroflexi bacterium]|nr:precorrin-6y C5,15-methyltransferase (decarboxylating) subunit CbiE [Chloroflexota bacterium]